MDYFEKHLFRHISISSPSSQNTRIVVTIPCFNEPHISGVLDSLEACDLPKSDVEVIVHVNSSEDSPEKILLQNQRTIEVFNEWNKDRKLKYFLLHSPALPRKHAGVGLARKIAMDEAAHRLQQSGNEKGVIVCLDADCTVDKNYLAEIEKHFESYPGSVGCSIYFEHPLTGNEFEQVIYDSIVNYELFLRYYILSLKWSGFPYAYHTIGSSMAVRANAYMKQGGMNRRKAGEDFYFLHKLFPFGKFEVLNTTCIIPSPRISDRVPFGTGADILKQLTRDDKNYFTYNFQTFMDLKNFLSLVPALYSKPFHSENISSAINDFLEKQNFEIRLEEIRSHTSNETAFTKRFFRWFEGFKVLKFVHFSRDHFYPNEEIVRSVQKLLESQGHTNLPVDKKELLLLVRKIERSNDG